MPLGHLQNSILKTMASNRSPESYLAGATVLHRDKKSPRYSQDLDFFHDVAQSVAQCAETDAETLETAGYKLEWLLRNPNFFRALVSLNDKSIQLEWAQDSAFRFFPVQEDPECGYRLHEADAAVNKMLALAGRAEVRDFVDILHLEDTFLKMGSLAWAACGKDPGFTPEFLLDQVARHAAYSQDDVNRLDLLAPMDIKDMKRKWLRSLAAANALVTSLPANEIGCLYLDSCGTPVNPDPKSEKFSTLVRHTGCISGAWPNVHG